MQSKIKNIGHNHIWNTLRQEIHWDRKCIATGSTLRQEIHWDRKYIETGNTLRQEIHWDRKYIKKKSFFLPLPANRNLFLRKAWQARFSWVFYFQYIVWPESQLQNINDNKKSQHISIYYKHVFVIIKSLRVSNHHESSSGQNNYQKKVLFHNTDSCVYPLKINY
jgi:hypothetical protein